MDETTTEIPFDEDKTLEAFLAECKKRGMVLPLILVAVRRGGTAMVLRWDGDDDGIEMLAEHYAGEDEGAMPTHLLVVDQNNKAIHGVIEFEGVTFH